MTTEPKFAVAATLDGGRDELVDLSHRIHANPELAFEEHRSAAWVAEALAAGGFDVETGACDLDTAIVATVGDGPCTVAICAEYDALPGIGHACGHNIIAAAAVGGGVALAQVADDVGLTVRVVGTPAEEGGGGKILMLARGAFDSVDAAMMVHPAPFERPALPCLVVQPLEVRFTGRTAHASAFPELGRNAADALTVAQVGIGLLRQHIPGTARIHGIVTDGGDAPNVVPDRTRGAWYVRAASLDALAELEPRVRACFEAGAVATGCDVEIVETGPAYSEFIDDPTLGGSYARNVGSLGRVFDELDDPGRFAGSTDMANVSRAVPAIHPMLGIDCLPAVNHQAEFAAACVTEVADAAVRNGAVAMAWTAIDLATDPAARDALRRAAARLPDASR